MPTGLARHARSCSPTPKVRPYAERSRCSQGHIRALSPLFAPSDTHPEPPRASWAKHRLSPSDLVDELAGRDVEDVRPSKEPKPKRLTVAIVAGPNGVRAGRPRWSPESAPPAVASTASCLDGGRRHIGSARHGVSCDPRCRVFAHNATNRCWARRRDSAGTTGARGGAGCRARAGLLRPARSHVRCGWSRPPGTPTTTVRPASMTPRHEYGRARPRSQSSSRPRRKDRPHESSRTAVLHSSAAGQLAR